MSLLQHELLLGDVPCVVAGLGSGVGCIEVPRVGSRLLPRKHEPLLALPQVRRPVSQLGRLLLLDYLPVLFNIVGVVLAEVRLFVLLEGHLFVVHRQPFLLPPLIPLAQLVLAFVQKLYVQVLLPQLFLQMIAALSFEFAIWLPVAALATPFAVNFLFIPLDEQLELTLTFHT